MPERNTNAFRGEIMSLNKQTGNMYSWVNATWNPIAGECLHKCSYCYVKKGRTKNLKKYQGITRIDEKCMKDNLGSGNFIFVGNMIDMFGEWVSDEIIIRVLEHCRRFDNKYLFQSKNPDRFWDFRNRFPSKTVLGTTIETNRVFFNNSEMIIPETRVNSMVWKHSFDKMVSIEPIMCFDLEPFVEMIKLIKPTFVSIGADSKKSGLNEPEPEKIRLLIKELEKFTEVRIKPNLNRLLRD